MVTVRQASSPMFGDRNKSDPLRILAQIWW